MLAGAVTMQSRRQQGRQASPTAAVAHPILFIHAAPQPPMTTSLDPQFAPLAAALSQEFALEAELGRGGMGVVFRATDLVLDRSVALKVLPPSLGADPEVRARFLREARTAGQLSHPHIVHIHRADERAGFAFFVMGLVEGENLGQRVRDRGPLPPADAVRHLREVAWALAYAHARGVIHRDVKPENIMIERGSNRALVTDFGIARVETAAHLTTEGHVVGTANFMSPEQVNGGTLDGRSDLYALGVVGYYLLSGRLPFEGLAPGAVLVAHATQTPPSLRSVAPRLPAALADVIDRCLAKQPADRFATGEDLAEALRRAMEGAVAAREPVVSDRHRTLSEDQAAVVWRRAAQLQAEAAARLERETRAHAVRTQLGEPVADEPAPGAAPTASYRLQDVEAAAIEAGISQRYVALAMSELPRDAAVPAAAVATGFVPRAASTLLGEPPPALSVTRIIQAPARDVLRAIGRVFQGPSAKLTLRDQIGAHPLDGGILVFNIPGMNAIVNGTHPFMQLRFGLYATEIRTAIRVLDRGPGGCEVSVHADLRPGVSTNVWMYTGIGSSMGAVGGVVGGIVGAKALAIAGVLLATPIATGIALGAAATVAVARFSYKYSVRKARLELEELLASVDRSLRTRSVFEEDPPALPRPSDASDDGMLGAWAGGGE
ncbi:MAG: hypothetical protein C0503_04975 [Gemmatimonas sp.]|nr:hypothetical protein [Gemmatimonas sp.]